MSQKTVFISGVTGFVGGTVLAALIPALREAGIDAVYRILVRNHAKEEKVKIWAKKIGMESSIECVLGGLSDEQVVVEEVSKADYIIDTADADNLDAAKNFVKGIEKAVESGRHPIFIHTSGTNIIADGADGMHSTDEIIHDANQAEIDAVPETNLHRDVDTLLRNFHNKNADKFDLAIMIPPCIWGFGRGPDNCFSIQIPHLIYLALKERQAYNVGDGKNVWTQIHVVDLAKFYAQLLVKMIQEPGKHTGFFLCENGEFEWREVGDQIQAGLKEAGFAVTSDKAKNTSKNDESIKVFEKVDFPYLPIIGGNSRVRSSRAQNEIGWTPKYSSKQQFLDDIPLLVYYLNHHSD
ncbi:hypothetical protein TRICI_005388 [Trichomonascus ciferrii]|uniref:NAD-dependent epimerase/dehydratase domain-containing protein n=1 Tax=Trichomonascus ciferrii TaxID=44093 RepID=A0A642USC3_9ASCO|nr:hypothetical protein TRICI_005388 [Trichomonascus ciferrii]